MSIKVKTVASEEEQAKRNAFIQLFRKAPIPDKEILSQIGVFQKRQDLTKVLYFNELYKRILGTHGIIIEFGTRWGQNMVTLNNLRGIYEPYNYSRKIIGFDTFSGFSGISSKDGHHDVIEEGSFSVSNEYENYLQEILAYHEQEAPLSHIRKNFVIIGDAPAELKKYLDSHPETIIALAHFDFDIYEPTKKCLEMIRPYLVKGSVISFDELNDPHFPGETIAVREVLGLTNIKLQRVRFSSMQSFFISE